MDDELLKDFLAEASELIETLDADLIGLEASPDDRDVLNGVFRAFHTIKGGAGFLGLEPLVDLCHRAEELLNLARSNLRSLDADDIDLVLRSIDEVKRMFGEIAAGEQPSSAPEALLAALEAAVDSEASAGSKQAPAPSDVGPAAGEHRGEGRAGGESDVDSNAPQAASSEDDPVLASFEEMLLGAEGEGQPVAESSPGAEPPQAEPLEDDFDALIDAIRAGDMDAARALDPSASASPSPPSKMSDAAVLPASAETSDSASLPVSSGASVSASSSASAEASGERAARRPLEPAAGATVAAPAEARAPAKAAARTAPGAAAVAQKPAEASLRIEAARIDDVMNLVGELVLVRNRLWSLRSRVRDDDLNRTLSNLDLVTSDLQSSVMRLRMQPVGKVFGRFPRVVRDVARQLGKEVLLEMTGESTELDKGMVESLADPLIHLVRNAIDHGIEQPAERARSGKPRAGKVVLAARQEGSHIFISVRDDGAGLDPAVIKQKAVERGLLDAHGALQLADEEALQMLFAPGFSTRSEVTDVSGRGVGLDVVKSAIGRVNGTVEIRSEKGGGTEFQIRLPLTLAILPALMVVVGGQVLALPLPIIEEITGFDPRDCSALDGREMLSRRGEVLPLLDLECWVGASSSADPEREKYSVIANTGTRRVALLVDKLLGQEDVVIKSLGTRLRALPGFAGATITGDGGIALIVDVGSLAAAWPQVATRAPARCAA